MMPPPPLPAKECINQFLQQAHRLGIQVRWTSEGMHNMDAAYRASHGTPGLIVIKKSEPRPNPKQICTLLSHEMVHVLQHWKSDLKAVTPLGWPRHGSPHNRELSVLEEEAYSAQNQPRKVLKAITKLKPIKP